MIKFEFKVLNIILLYFSLPNHGHPTMNLNITV